jgi:hypothetical protein
VRASYYLGRILLQLGQYDRGTVIERQARDDMADLLQMTPLEAVGQPNPTDDLLFDFLVSWESRLVTPRKAGTQVPQTDAST